MHHQFQEEVRRALTKYALVPVLLLAFLGSLLICFSWHHYIVMRNEASRQTAAEVLTGILTDYEQRADRVAERLADGPQPLASLGAPSPLRTELYAYLYHEVNITHDATQFFLLDRSCRVLFGSRHTLPAALTPLSETWGIVRRLKEQPTRAQAEFLTHPGAASRDLLVGRAIVQDGALAGYMLFVVPGEYLTHSITSPHLYFLLADDFQNGVLATGGGPFTTRFGKVADVVAAASSKRITYQKGEYYISQQPLPQGCTLYAITPVTDLLLRYLIGAGLLLAIALIMVPIILCSVGQESARRAKAVDELVEAFARAKRGDLSAQLTVRRGSQLEVVTEAYNHMTHSLRALMQQHEAETRATVISEVRQLESQFQPHFLFNTLENIKFMIKLDPDAAMQMIQALSSLLRYSIRTDVRQVTVDEDLAYTHNYLKIQQYRFGSRLRYEEDIARAARCAAIPKLLFQPVLENAIRYGSDDDGNISIRLTVRRDGALLRVTIEDQGKGLGAAKLAEMRALLKSRNASSRHTGLYNVHRRIQLMYGEAYGLAIACPETGGTRVTLTLPAVRKEEMEECSP